MQEDIQKIEKLLSSFERYYTIRRDEVTLPFTAEADFISHNEQYMLIKAAKIADIDSNDYAFFKYIPKLTVKDLMTLSETAWNTGVGRVKPYYGHRNSDVTLLIVADQIEAEAVAQIKKIKYSKSYKFTIYGWSNFRLAAIELETGNTHSNRLGKDLKKLLANIKN